MDNTKTENDESHNNQTKNNFLKKLKSSFKKPKFLIEVLALIGLVGYTAISAFQWGAMKGQLEQMKRQLEMADRPWIKDTVTPAYDFTFDKGAISWSVNIRVENVGHSVATIRFAEARLIAVHGADIIDGPRQQAKEFCDNLSDRYERVDSYPSVWGTAVFPGDPANFPYSTILWQSGINNATFDGGADLGKSVMPMLIGCIKYHYPTSDKPHKTWFVYFISHSDNPALSESSRIFFSIGKTVPKGQIVLTKSGQFAD